MPSSVPLWNFGPFALDSTNACLWRGAEAVALPPKAFDVLHYLVMHPDRLVTKDELLDAIWPRLPSQMQWCAAIGALRKVLDDTTRGRPLYCHCAAPGLSLLAPVTVADAAASPAATPLRRPPHPLLPSAPGRTRGHVAAPGRGMGTGAPGAAPGRVGDGRGGMARPP